MQVETFPPTDEITDFVEFMWIPLRQDRSFLNQKYVVEELSIDQISKRIFSSKESVRSGLLKATIPLREPHKNPARIRYGQRKQKGRPVRHLDEERVIMAIKDMRQQGLSLRQIATFLSEIGVPTKHRAKGWHPEMVKRILDYDARLGKLTCAKETLDGSEPK